MAKLYNLAAMTVASTGTGTITLGAAATINTVLFLSFAAAGAVDGDIVAYSINDVGQSEHGIGTIGGGVTTLTRGPTNSTNANAAINMTAAAIVRISPRKQDIANLGETNTFAAVQTVSDNAVALPAIGSFTPILKIGRADDVQTVINIQSWSSTNSKQPGIIYGKARGTAAAPTALLIGDFLFSNFGFGYATSGGAGYVTGAGAGFIAVATDNYTSTVAGSRLDFYATPVGTGALALSASAGAGFMVGTTTDPGAKNINCAGAIFTASPVTLTGTSGSVGASDSTIFVNESGNFTITLPSAASNVGRWLYLQQLGTSLVSSASSNVTALGTTTAGTLILQGTVGKWAALQSDGTNWRIMMAA